MPWAPDVQVVYEHYHRYLWAARLVGGQRVLDLGSGEGFGAAILADSATTVIGLDIDEPSVIHSRLNYGGVKLAFEQGSAVDLTRFADGTFDAVVAFEVIEHIAEQEQVIAEVERVLADDGLLIMSTPDRHMYAKASPEPNPFHERELATEEFRALLAARFAHVQLWGQRTISGSYLGVAQEASEEERATHADFFIERQGGDWGLAGTPATLYCVALASNAPLPAVALSSTLADLDLELMRVKEREAHARWQERDALYEQIVQERGDGERERRELVRAVEEERAELHNERLCHQRALRDERDQRDVEILAARAQVTRADQAVADLGTRLVSAETQLAASRQASRRVEESVTWQAFQRVRSRLYRVLGGERSLSGRLLGVLLRLGGRLVLPRASQPVASGPDVSVPELIEFPEFTRPQASLIIPVYAHSALTKACLCSIRDHTSHARYEVILVDDKADEQTKALLTTVRGARVVRNEHNQGFLRSMNNGARAANGEWLVLFNNDTEVRDGWLASMLACAESAEDVGVVTPKFVYPDGTLNEAGGIVWRDGTAMNYGRGDVPDRFQYEYRRETDYGSAAALMVKRELWAEIGGFDERYVPIYYEDTDVCFQARERGLRVLYEPEAVVVHIEGATSGTNLQSGAKRHQELNRQKFVRKWRAQLEVEHRHPSLANVRVAANRDPGHHVLVMDHRVPMPDRDAGSLRMLAIMRALVEMGARVTFVPENLAPLEPYTRALQRLGIEVLYGPIDIRAELATLASSVRTAILCRPHTASHYLDSVRDLIPAAQVLYDTVDLHWVREARRGFSPSQSGTLAMDDMSLDSASLGPKAKALRELELALVRATDATLVVSDEERRQVERDVPGAHVFLIPTVHDVAEYVPPPDSRSGILFVGGFEHPPNVDAAVCLVREVMPEVWAALGAVRVTIAGPGAPAEVQGLAAPMVDVVGWVEDLQPLLERSRLLIAPLRYGAGIKGKITQCLAAGLPVVTTPVGAEGLAALSAETDVESDCLLVADDIPGLATHTVRLYTDDDLWRSLSRSGRQLIEDRCSTAVLTERLGEILGEPCQPTPEQASRLA